ncbi:MAG: NifB/NifX family molybdenum-iron cluster-binding protein [Gammaproteobacteria bacterium]
MNRQVNQRGARAPYYLFFDTETGMSEALPNPVAEGGRNADPQAAAFLVSKGVDKVVADDFGPRFSAELDNAGIVYVEKTGPISVILPELKR